MEQKKEELIQEKKPLVEQGVLPQQKKEDIRRGQEGIDTEGNTHEKKLGYQEPVKQVNSQAKQI